MRLFTSIGCSSTSNPATLAVPALGGRKQVSTRMVVVLPAPFGPRKPTICPFSTSNEILSTATVRAYRLVRPSTLIMLVYPRQNRRGRCHLGTSGNSRMSSATVYRLNFYDRDAGQVLSNEGGWPRRVA